MGGETSRLARRASRRSRSGAEEEETEDVADWEHVKTSSLDEWKEGHCENLGFDCFDNWHRYNLKVHKKPWKAFSISGKLHPLGKEKKICEFSCEVHETGRHEKVSWWMKDCSVLAISEKIAVVQVVVAKVVKILVVDWRNSFLLATYSFAFIDEACLQECFVSPDSQILLLRQNFHLRRSLGHISGFDANIRVIQVKNGFCERLFVLEDNLGLLCFGSGIAFDPRVVSGRVVLVAGSIRPNDDVDDEDDEDRHDGIQVYDLDEQELVLSRHGTTDRVVHHVVYSSDGAFLAVMCVNISMAVISTIFIDRVQILNGSSFDLLHEITFQYCGPCKPLLSQAFPAFSRDGSHLAVISISNNSIIDIYKMPCVDLGLQAACRRSILRRVSFRHIDELPLPKKLIYYLRHNLFL